MKASSSRSAADSTALYSKLNALCEKYPFLAVSSLGTSLLGKPIPLVKLGDEGCSRQVLYVASHHSSEWICTSVLLRFIEEYCQMYKSSSKIYGANISTIYSSSLIYIVPMLNPDGVDIHLHGAGAAGPMKERVMKMNGGGDFTHWQSNARGVDLNHNYDAGFAEYKRLERKAGIMGGAPTRFSGEYPESEPEVGYLCNFIRFNDKIRAVLTLHTQGEEIYYTSGSAAAPQSSVLAARIAAMTGYSLSEPDGMASYGGMTDWMIQKVGKPSFTIECGKGQNPLPPDCAFEIYTRLRETLFTFPLAL